MTCWNKYFKFYSDSFYQGTPNHMTRSTTCWLFALSYAKINEEAFAEAFRSLAVGMPSLLCISQRTIQNKRTAAPTVVEKA